MWQEKWHNLPSPSYGLHIHGSLQPLWGVRRVVFSPALMFSQLSPLSAPLSGSNWKAGRLWETVARLSGEDCALCTGNLCTHRLIPPVIPLSCDNREGKLAVILINITFWMLLIKQDPSCFSGSQQISQCRWFFRSPNRLASFKPCHQTVRLEHNRHFPDVSHA